MAKQTITVYIDAQYNYYIEENQVAVEFLTESIGKLLEGQTEGTVVLRSDQTVPVQYVVNLIDAVNQVNEMTQSKHKVILATRPVK